MATIEEYDLLDAVGLAELVKQGEVTPSELLDTARQRIESRNPKINAVVFTFYEHAEQQIAQGLPDGPFKGVPFLLKDLLQAYEGTPLTASSRFFADYIPHRNSELWRRYQRSGLVAVGRTNLPELGLLGITEPALRGPTLNPWDTRLTPGGSSGGAGAAVAARMVPMAHGGDGGGSIRIPASFNGLVGLKPSRGRNPVGPGEIESWSGLVSEHVITRSVRDSAAMLDVTAGGINGSVLIPPGSGESFLDKVSQPPPKLRIAYTADSLYGKHTHPDCTQALEKTIQLLQELGHEVINARPDFDKRRALMAYITSFSASTKFELDAAARQLGKTIRGSQFEAVTWMIYNLGRIFDASELAAAQDTQRELIVTMRAFFDHYDVFLTPTVAYPPVATGALSQGLLERMVLRLLATFPVRAAVNRVVDEIASTGVELTPNTTLFNQTGSPAISLPLFWSDPGLLPVGSQFAAAYGNEALLFQLAGQLEQANPWAERRPDWL